MALLLLASAAAFGVGRELERSVEARSEERGEALPPEGSETAEGRVPSVLGLKELFGIDPDSPPLTVAGVVLTLVLAAGVTLSASRALLKAVALFGLAFVILDIWELARQIERSRTSLVVAAALVGALHLPVAMTAIFALRVAGQPQRPP